MSLKIDSASAPSLKTWTPNPLRNPVCRQILEPRSALNSKNAAGLRLQPLPILFFSSLLKISAPPKAPPLKMHALQWF